LITLRSPDDIIADREADEETVRITLDIRASAARFLERYADHRTRVAANLRRRELEASGAAPKKTDKPKEWVRKTLTEALLEGLVEDLRADLEPMFKTFGKLPDPKDEAAAEKYADAVVEQTLKSRS
jgi:hypothetical protein